MPHCTTESVTWKNRHAWRLSNHEIEITVLLGGGHIADLRLCDSPVNALWEAPWTTIEPHHFSPSQHSAVYGDRPVGQMLSGYTGHALALGYFGMPSTAEEKRGMSLHGEAASAEWCVVGAEANDRCASLSLQVDLPRTALRCRRRLTLAAGARSLAVQEIISNLSPQARDLQWVQHAAFGEPLYARGMASLSLSGERGITWPLGYEGHALLPDNQRFHWPRMATPQGEMDLSQPFLKDGSGFVAAVRSDPMREEGFIAIHNRSLAIAAGYVYDARRFPWIALWEENRARQYAPWNGITRVRGVEFGTSPMPLGLEHARQMRSLFDTPVLTNVAENGQLSTEYDIFITAVPPQWVSLRDVSGDAEHLILHSHGSETFTVRRSAASSV